jgi:hypothetical protein
MAVVLIADLLDVIWMRLDVALDLDLLVMETDGLIARAGSGRAWAAGRAGARWSR